MNKKTLSRAGDSLSLERHNDQTVPLLLGNETLKSPASSDPENIQALLMGETIPRVVQELDSDEYFGQPPR